MSVAFREGDCCSVIVRTVSRMSVHLDPASRAAKEEDAERQGLRSHAERGNEKELEGSSSALCPDIPG